MLATSDAGQAVEGPVLALVVGALDHQDVALLADGDGAGQPAGQRALGALTVTVLSPSTVTVTPDGTGMGERPMRDISDTSSGGSVARPRGGAAERGYQT